MKTLQMFPPKTFAPVHLVLETQEEVDCMRAIFNTSPIARVLEGHGVERYPYELFKCYVDRPGSEKIFEELRNALKMYYNR